MIQHDVRRYHGGRVAEGVIDFSVPLNPLGPPEQVLKIFSEIIKNNINIITRYPDYEYHDLRNSIANFYEIKSEGIIPLNGAAEALYILLTVYKPKNFIVIEPTFGDYRVASQALGIQLISIPYVEGAKEFTFPINDILTLSKDVVRNSMIFLSNPNNPTGYVVEVKYLREIAETFDESLVVVDEAFIDLSEKFQESCLNLVEELDNVVVIRSLTKTFSVPGLRIGFMYSSKMYSKLFDLYRQPWNVNIIADRLFTNLLSKFKDDMKKFLEMSRQYISIEKSRLTTFLRSLGFTVYDSYAPYILVKSSKVSATDLNEMLMKYGMYVRDASSFTPLTKYFFRVGVRSRDDNNRFIEVMNKLFGVDNELRKKR